MENREGTSLGDLVGKRKQRNYAALSAKGVSVDLTLDSGDLYALSQLAETLKGYEGNETVAKQCQVINENYVDNVVLATYRTLADNAQKLYQTIVKIKNAK